MQQRYLTDRQRRELAKLRWEDAQNWNEESEASYALMDEWEERQARLTVRDIMAGLRVKPHKPVPPEAA
jgi:hypothetical protein